MSSNTQCDVLLVTVTDVETETLLETAKTRTGRDYKTEPGNQKTYFDLGMIGGARVFAVRSEMGSDTLGGSLLTVKDAISEVKPSAVIMVGIAFGINPKKQKIGEVLVAKQLLAYDLQRVSTTETGSAKIVLRGDKPHCSEKLLDRFRTARLRWKKAQVNFGLVLSGEKLIDNIDFRDQLLSLSEEAIGGEMEGGGLYAASQQSKVDWILVKAICDWADGKKDVRRKVRQKTAAASSADFVFEMLGLGLLASDQSATAFVPEQVKEAVGLESPPLIADRVSIARLPTGGNELFGRDEELKLLDDAWNHPSTNIVCFVAWGGVGKTALVNHWLKKRMARDNYRGAERVYGWSFFSQGTNERAASADLFIDQALRWFGDTDPTAGSPWDKGERLANYLRQTRTLLILDGLEPLQHPPGPQEGKLKDAAMQALLVELAAQQPGLCVISTRERIGDLIEFENGTVIKHDLNYLSRQAGAQILRSLNVRGDDEELEQASGELGGHAFSLTLLGSYLEEVFAGDIRRRTEIENLFHDTRYGEKAEAMIAAYEQWLREGMELAILRLLGFFNRPADAVSVTALREPPVIRGLTEPLQHFKAREWSQAVAKLRRIKLLADPSPSEPGTLDAHPLLREYFKQQLKGDQADAWRAGNLRLYDHLKNTTKELPDTIQEMSPLFACVAHGCEAGLHQQAFREVYLRRIQRGEEFFILNMLGAFGTDLGALLGFFETPWTRPIGDLPEKDAAFLLNQAGSDLRAIGRFHEAEEPTHAALIWAISSKSWKNAAIAAQNLSEYYLTTGDLLQAVGFASQGIDLADKSGQIEERRDNRATLAYALHQVGHIDQATTMFEEAEDIHKKVEPAHLWLYSVQGFQYSQLLMETDRAHEAKERSQRNIELWSERTLPLAMAFDTLSFCCAHIPEISQETMLHDEKIQEKLGQALEFLRQFAPIDFLPYAMLTRAQAALALDDHIEAERELLKVSRISSRCGMALHLAEFHLKSARLRLAQGNNEQAREHWVTAKEMIEKMGYHRRDKEVENIEKQLG